MSNDPDTLTAASAAGATQIFERGIKNAELNNYYGGAMHYFEKILKKIRLIEAAIKPYKQAVLEDIIKKREEISQESEALKRKALFEELKHLEENFGAAGQNSPEVQTMIEQAEGLLGTGGQHYAELCPNHSKDVQNEIGRLSSKLDKAIKTGGLQIDKETLVRQKEWPLITPMLRYAKAVYKRIPLI